MPANKKNDDTMPANKKSDETMPINKKNDDTMPENNKNDAYSGEFKAKVVRELERGTKTLQDLAASYQLDPAMITQWHEEYLANLYKIFAEPTAPSPQDNEIKTLKKQLRASQEKLTKLNQECDWLMKKSDEVFGTDGLHRKRYGKD